MSSLAPDARERRPPANDPGPKRSRPGGGYGGGGGYRSGGHGHGHRRGRGYSGGGGGGGYSGGGGARPREAVGLRGPAPARSERSYEENIDIFHVKNIAVGSEGQFRAAVTAAGVEFLVVEIFGKPELPERGCGGEFKRDGFVTMYRKAAEAGSGRKMLALEGRHFGPEWETMTLKVEKLERTDIGQYSVCAFLGRRRNNGPPGTEVVHRHFPPGTFTDARRHDKPTGMVCFFVDMSTVRDFCEILLTQPPVFEAIRPAPPRRNFGRPYETGRGGPAEIHSRLGTREAREGTIEDRLGPRTMPPAGERDEEADERANGELAGRTGRLDEKTVAPAEFEPRRREVPEVPRVEVLAPAPPEKVVDLRHSLSNRSVGQAKKPGQTLAQPNVVDAGPAMELSARAPEEGKKEDVVMEPRPESTVEPSSAAAERVPALTEPKSAAGPAEPVSAAAEPVSAAAELVCTPAEPVTAPTEQVTAAAAFLTAASESVQTKTEPSPTPVEPVTTPTVRTKTEPLAAPVCAPVGPVTAPAELVAVPAENLPAATEPIPAAMEPALAQANQEGGELSLPRKNVSPKREELAVSASRRSPGRGERNVSAPQASDRRSTRVPEACLPLIEELRSLCLKSFRRGQTFVLSNLPFVDRFGDVAERVDKQGRLRAFIASKFNVSVVGVMLLDHRGGTAVVGVESENDAAVLNDPINAEFEFGSAGGPRLAKLTQIQECMKFATFNQTTTPVSRAQVDDLVDISAHDVSKAVVVSYSGDGTFTLKGDLFNLLVVLAMSGRMTWSGTGLRKYNHQFCRQRQPGRDFETARPAPGPVSNGHSSGAHRARIEHRLLVKNVRCSARSLVSELKRISHITSWIETEQCQEPDCYVVIVYSQDIFDCLLRQDGAELFSSRGKFDNFRIEVKPYESDRGGETNGEAPLPLARRTYRSADNRGLASHEHRGGAHRPTQREDSADYAPGNGQYQHERHGDRRWSEGRPSRFGNAPLPPPVGERRSRFGDHLLPPSVDDGHLSRNGDFNAKREDVVMGEGDRRRPSSDNRDSGNGAPGPKLVAASCGRSRGFRASPVTPSPTTTYTRSGKKDRVPEVDKDLKSVVSRVRAARDEQLIASRTVYKPPGKYSDFLTTVRTQCDPEVARQVQNAAADDDDDAPDSKHVWSGLMYMEGSTRGSTRRSTPGRSTPARSTPGTPARSTPARSTPGVSDPSGPAGIRKRPKFPAHCNGFVVAKEKQSVGDVDACIKMLPPKFDIEFRQGWDNPKHSELLNEDAVVFMVRSSLDVEPPSVLQPRVTKVSDEFGREMAISAVASQKSLLGMLRSLRDVQRFGVCRYIAGPSKKKMAALCIPPSAHAFERLGVPWRFRDMAGHDTMLVVVGRSQSFRNRT